MSGGVNTGGDNTISVECGCMYLKKVKNKGSGAVIRVNRSLCVPERSLRRKRGIWDIFSHVVWWVDPKLYVYILF